MKNLCFLSLAAVALSAGCSNDETVGMPAGRAIGFESFVNKSTRGAADDLTAANLTDFRVFGFMTGATGQIFTGERVQGSGTDWNYANTQYWTADKDYWFSAVAPADNGNWAYDVNGKVEGGILNFTNEAGTTDLLYAYSDRVHCAEPAAQGKVAFTFNHLLSRVKFDFTNAMGNDNTFLQVTEVSLIDAPRQGTCDVSVSPYAWQLGAEAAPGALAFGSVLAADAKIANGLHSATDHKYMIPQTQAYRLDFTVVMYQGGEVAATYRHTGVTVPSVVMEPGKSYVFSAELNYKNVDPDEELYPIEFTVEKVDDWGAFTEPGTEVTLPEHPAQP